MVRPEKILKDLSALWVDLGHEQQEETPHGSGVLRACAMTLLTISDESEDPTNVGETVAMLMKEHPSRSVLIRVRAGGDEDLASRVFAQCWMPMGQRLQICCEQIEITASPKSLDDVPGVVLPLTVPDLPIILWNRSPRLFDTPAFPKIAGICDKLIVDTNAFEKTAQGFDILTAQIGGNRLVADLAWARITRWRESISQIFGNQECLDALNRFNTATVEYGTAEAGPEALYLAAWLQNGMGKAGNQTQVQLVRGEGPRISALRIGGTAQCNVSIQCDSSGAVEVSAGRLSNRTIFPEATDYVALREELSITTRDPAFEAALPVARTLLNRGRTQ